ncbi:DUF7511 domain-containing protein [Natrarchaeobius chitinivorans]|uniref:DUF7511 domain-containing protein n=1 Tax=Natrarchaeobius chitinivorans TaxID=1679083 RepID=A0A3N6MLL5_NATCH|nr:hypothetical protein [Natrarchaeobius chitinivorans]RQG95256.1 hypothetical protein EA473_09765 [Natrarchaeobius chitinivorans]
MTDRNVDAEPTPPAERQADSDGVSPWYQAYVDRREHGPDVCTIYNAFDAESVTEERITAIGDAFVSREDAR